MIETSTSGLKAKLGQFMKAVREGREVIITDRDRPVARLVPYVPDRSPQVALVCRPRDPGAPPLAEVEIRPISLQRRSSTDLLREDRDRR